MKELFPSSTPGVCKEGRAWQGLAVVGRGLSCARLQPGHCCSLTHLEARSARRGQASLFGFLLPFLCNRPACNANIPPRLLGGAGAGLQRKSVDGDASGLDGSGRPRCLQSQCLSPRASPGPPVTTCFMGYSGCRRAATPLPPRNPAPLLLPRQTLTRRAVRDGHVSIRELGPVQEPGHGPGQL